MNIERLLSPLSELLEDDAVGEALSADANPLEDSVTPQLVQDQVRLQFTSLKEQTDTPLRPESRICILKKKYYYSLYMNKIN